LNQSNGCNEELKKLIKYLRIHHIEKIEPSDILDTDPDYKRMPEPHSCRSLKYISHEITTIHEFEILNDRCEICDYYLNTENRVCLMDTHAYAIIDDHNTISSEMRRIMNITGG
jgi:hypothetical protein